MVFANPVEGEFVSGAYYNDAAAPFYLSADKLAGDYSPVRFARELKVFRAFCRSGRVLDVGCSTGAFLHQLQVRYGKDYEVLGTDVAGPALDYAKKMGVPTLAESFLTAESLDSSFDAVTFWAVLEHLVNPREFLVKAASCLQPNGHCFVLVPNFHSLAVRLLGPKYRYILPQHVNYFTAATLRHFGESEPRFTIRRIISTHFNPLVILQDLKRRGHPVPDEDRAKLLAQTTRYKQAPLLAPAKWAVGAMESILATGLLADNLVMVLQKTKS
jgi:2-polyprenyl-3-methyl-5-hydroxy-6-metoxy-1,4-benzoquinol methylase